MLNAGTSHSGPHGALYFLFHTFIGQLGWYHIMWALMWWSVNRISTFTKMFAPNFKSGAAENFLSRNPRGKCYSKNGISLSGPFCSCSIHGGFQTKFSFISSWCFKAEKCRNKLFRSSSNRQKAGSTHKSSETKTPSSHVGGLSSNDG